MRKIHGAEVHGVNVDPQTRCAHYRSELDIIALKFKCCGKWFPCYECHAECAGHVSQTWTQEEFQTHAVLCGCCGHQMRITEYFDCHSVCPKCGAKFNPNCSKHYALYFEVIRE